MSLLSFGRLIFSSEQEKNEAEKINFSMSGCHIRTEDEVCEVTHRVLDKLLSQDGLYFKAFELSDGPKDNTAEYLFAPKYYGTGDLRGLPIVEILPLYERMELVQKFFEQIFSLMKPTLIKLCICDEGYPILSDCKIMEVSLSELAQKLYDEYDDYCGTPTLLITIRK